MNSAPLFLLAFLFLAGAATASAIPSEPTGFEAHTSPPGTPLQINLRWDPVPGASSYHV
jgi:hypothetical protein